MNEHVITVMLLDETKALLFVEPLHHALNTHTRFSL
jgi:hypothetical protein